MTGTTKKSNNKTRTQDAQSKPFGAEAFTNGFEKAFGGYGDIAAFGKENYEALLECTHATKSGLEVLQGEALAFSKHALEESAVVAEAAIKARSVQELVEIQSNFAKSAFESFVTHANKWAGMLSDTAREAAEPLNSRLSSVFNKVA